MAEAGWIDLWQSLDAAQAERLGRAIGRLLEDGIVMKGPATSPSEEYRALDRFEEAARGYLRVIGWDLALDRPRGFAHAINLAGRCRAQLTKDESIVLCLLRLLFHERASQATWQEEVLVSVGEIQEAYLTYAGGRKPLGKLALASALRRFQRLNLVALPRPFEPEPDTVLEVLPTVTAALPVSALETVASRLRAYTGAQSQAAAEGGEP